MILKKSLLVICFAVVFLSFVAASGDVAYVYSSSWLVDDVALQEFDNMDLSVEMISCSDVSSTDFSEYGMIFVGNEWLSCAKEIPIDEVPSVVMNGRNIQDFGLSGKRGFSTMSSNLPFKTSSDEMFSAYSEEFERLKNTLIIYALRDYVENEFEKVAEKYMNEDVDLGAAVAYVDSGSSLVNGKTAEENICFFGLVESDYWTPESKGLFGECVGFASGSSGGDGGDGDGDGDDVPDEPEDMVHDIALSDLHIRNVEGDVPILTQGESYGILVDLENLGDYVESVTFEGTIRKNDVEYMSFNHAGVSPLEVGMKKNDKVRTVNFDLEQGFYQIDVEAFLAEGVVDSNTANNKVTIMVNVI